MDLELQTSAPVTAGERQEVPKAPASAGGESMGDGDGMECVWEAERGGGVSGGQGSGVLSWVPLAVGSQRAVFLQAVSEGLLRRV